ncbi:hypothetical protein [Robbsia sp. KACC 23696]|uniref:hypothetical protein n=1 Tax=Robbsia sp. KACC 23696 TaxID=3149231 RepID=UPI00325A5600
MKIVNHPLEYNDVAKAYFKSLAARASKGGVCVWREVVEQLTGSLPTYATRKQRARQKVAVVRMLGGGQEKS